MSEILDPIRQEVSELTTVIDSAVALLKLLAAKVKGAVTLEEAQAIATEIDAKANTLAAAVTENTPAATP